MQASKQNQSTGQPQKKFSKFGNRIKSRVNTRIVSSQTDFLQNLNQKIPDIPLTPLSTEGFQFSNFDCDLTQSTTSFSVKKLKSVKFDDTPISKTSNQSSYKKLPVSILKNTSLEKQNSSILSGSRNLLNNSSFYSNANTERSKLSASDSVVQDQRQVLVERKKYTQLLQNCIYHKKKYFDDIFPPGSSSIYSKIKHNNKYGDIKWVRLGQLYKNHKQYIYSYHKSLQNEIGNGGFGIPYLLPCLQILQTNTRCLQRIFEDQKPNQTGIYCLRIFLNGVWKYVIVDDYIPTITIGKNQVPLFIDIAGKRRDKINIWPYLLIKAYAKVYTSYQALEQGNVFDFMNQLTGTSIERLLLNKQTLQQLNKYYNNTDYLILLGKKVNDELQYFPSDNGRNQTFMISNYLSSSTIVSVDKTKISTSQIVQVYEQAIVAKVDQMYYSVSCTIHQAKQTMSIRYFKTTQQISCHISLIQKDIKYYKKCGYKYSWVRLMICMKQSQGMRYITGDYKNDKAIHLDCTLEPGQYYLIVIADWDDKVYNISLTYNGPVSITFERKTEKEVPNLFQQACADIAQRFGQFKQLSSNLCSYRCIFLPLGILIQNLNNQNGSKDIAIIKAYGQVLNQVKMKGKIKCFDKQFIKQQYTLSKRVKPKDHYTLVMMLTDSKVTWKGIEHFVFDQ